MKCIAKSGDQRSANKETIKRGKSCEIGKVGGGYNEVLSVMVSCMAISLSLIVCKVFRYFVKE